VHGEDCRPDIRAKQLYKFVLDFLTRCSIFKSECLKGERNWGEISHYLTPCETYTGGLMETSI